MNPLKQLAGQTGLYGISSILGRLLNFLLVPVHTVVFFRGEFGTMSDLYAQMAFFIILYTYGMETAYFRFSSQSANKTKFFNITTTSILLSGLLFSTVIIFFAQNYADLVGISDQVYIIYWMAAILWLDAIIAIPFAKLRLENKTLKFVSIRFSGIALTVLLNMLFLRWIPQAQSGNYGDWLYSLSTQFHLPEIGIGYVFLANLIGSVFMLLLLAKELLQWRFAWDTKVLKELLIYALPIMLMGLLGTIPEQLDKLMIKYYLPVDFYANKNPEEALGVYNAAFKLSIFMMLAIQAFRFAGEPFFFSRASDKNAPKLFADILYYFTLGCLLIFVGVSLNVEWIAQLFLRQESYREALFLVPILLFGKVFFGMYTHLSIWFKLTNQTYYGIYFAALAAAITIIGNVLLIPIIGYTGSALSAVAAYFGMSAFCYIKGQKKYPIPYPITKLAKQIGLALTLVGFYYFYDFGSEYIKLFSGILLSLIYLLYIVLTEKRKILNTKY